MEENQKSQTTVNRRMRDAIQAIVGHEHFNAKTLRIEAEDVNTANVGGMFETSSQMLRSWVNGHWPIIRRHLSSLRRK